MWMNVAGFREILDICSRIQGQSEGNVGGFMANLDECSRVQGQLRGM
jgi:hypothetical protein